MAEALADISTMKLGGRASTGGPPRILALTIVSHSSMARAGERSVLDALAAGIEVPLSRMSPDFRRRAGQSGRPLEDPGISRQPFILAPTEGGGVVLRVAEGGTPVSVDGEPVTGPRVLEASAITAGVSLVLSSRVVLFLHVVEPNRDGPEDHLDMVGESTGIRRVREQIRNVLDLDVPVLVRGEMGTGKKRIAQALHQRGSRRNGPFVSVNLGALPKEMVVAELFGAKRGAFTGADRDREGYFRAARGGTLFLDEVGEAPPEVQVTLLRVLETGEFHPVGSQTPVKLDVRLVTATDADLEARIQAGQFRAPLWHRLAGYEIQLPPLRERREDIGLLFAHFAREELEELSEAWRLTPDDPRSEPWLPAELALGLLRYSWPGNIRQLRSMTRQLIISNRGRSTLKMDARLVRELGLTPSSAQTPAAPLSVPVDVNVTLPPRREPSEVSRDELAAALRACEWDLQAVADKLGLPRSSVYSFMEKHQFRTVRDLTAEEITRCHQECGGRLGEMVKRLEVSRLALRRRVKEQGLEVDES